MRQHLLGAAVVSADDVSNKITWWLHGQAQTNRDDSHEVCCLPLLSVFSPLILFISSPTGLLVFLVCGMFLFMYPCSCRVDGKFARSLSTIGKTRDEHRKERRVDKSSCFAFGKSRDWAEKSKEQDPWERFTAKENNRVHTQGWQQGQTVCNTWPLRLQCRFSILKTIISFRRQK